VRFGPRSGMTCLTILQLEFLVAAYDHIMLIECADYEKWKTRDTAKPKTTDKNGRRMLISISMIPSSGSVLVELA